MTAIAITLYLLGVVVMLKATQFVDEPPWLKLLDIILWPALGAWLALTGLWILLEYGWSLILKTLE